MANPELMDPIYSDLKSQYEAAKSAVEAEKKALDEIIAEIETFKPRDPRLKRSMRERFTRERNVAVLEQKALYFEIRLEQRKTFAERDYLKAFNAGKEWPNPDEFKAYKLQRKLETASRNWDDRVPRTDRYNSAKVGKMSKREPAEAKPAGHGEGEGSENAEAAPSGH